MKQNRCGIMLLVAAFIFGGMVTGAFAQEAKWLTDYGKAVEQAKAQKKLILLDFTGSDWCGWCIKFDKEVLSTKEFKEYADKNLILVTVDFPNAKHQTKKVKEQNDELKSRFGVSGFPTFVFLDQDGKELGRSEGYLPGGPAAFTAKLDSFKKP